LGCGGVLEHLQGERGHLKAKMVYRVVGTSHDRLLRAVLQEKKKENNIGLVVWENRMEKS
jgi:hypothetical protein